MADITITANRLGQNYHLAKLIDDLQVITGQLDQDTVPKRSIAEHLNMATFEVVSLLNSLCAPWYGIDVPLDTIIVAQITGLGLATWSNNTVVSIPLNGINGVSSGIIMSNGLTNPTIMTILDSNAIYPKVEKVLAVFNDLPNVGSVKQARDISQFWGIAKGNNSQWGKSCVWIHFGDKLSLWRGSDSDNFVSLTDKFYASVYRQAAPMHLDGPSISSEKEYNRIDIPDKYVPLVVAKAALFIMKQKSIGNYQEVEGTVNQGIAQIQQEFEKNMGLSMQRSQMENVERTAY